MFAQGLTNPPDHQPMSGKKTEMSGRKLGEPDTEVWSSDRFQLIFSSDDIVKIKSS
jgi:hypothetical protein